MNRICTISVRRARPALAAGLLALGALSVHAAQGTWTAAPPEPLNGGAAFGLWLLTDGTVLSHSNALNHWCKLVPDATGSYANGTWVQLADSPWALGGAEEHVLKDGRFLETGAEYVYAWPTGSSGTDYNDVQIYDPVANTWTIGPKGLYADIGDSGSAMLSDGRVFGSSRATTAAEIYNPVTNAWTAAAGHPWGSGDEDAWTSLPNGGVLSVCNTGAGVYNPATNAWTKIPYPAGFVPGDIGPTELMYDGRVLCLGYESTAIFTPGATPSTGSWVMGPAYPGGPTEDDEDEYGCCEPNGKVMFAAYPLGESPNELVEFDPTTNTFSTITPPPDPVGPYPVSYCVLPNGQVMVCCGAQDWLYTPSGGPQDSWRPTVTSVAADSDGSYILTGTQLSGLVNGWDEGDDMSGAENYPIVWLTNSAGKVWYCKSYNFSTMMPGKGSAPQTCRFKTPAGLPSGTYGLYVSALGVPSKTAYSFTFGVVDVSTTLTASFSGSSVTLSWKPVAGFSAFRVSRATASGAEATLVPSVSGTSYVDSAVTGGYTYYYEVTGVSATGTETKPSNEASATPTGPAAATNFTATPLSAAVSLSWTASPGATLYNVMRAARIAGPYTVIARPASTRFTDTDALNGVTYYYEVAPVDAIGTGPATAPAAATPNASDAPPATPTGLTASAGAGSVALKWIAAARAASYSIKRATGASGPFTALMSVSAPAYADTGVTAGKTYYYMVVANNAYGTSANSATVGAVAK